MTTGTERGRSALLDWQAEKPRNYFNSDPGLGRSLATRIGAERLNAERPRLEAIGQMVGSELSRLAIETNLDENLPRLERFDALGVRTEEIVFHPSYHAAGRLIWQTGILSDYAEPGRETLQMAIMYMLAQPGENGHNCPLACTAGLIKLLQRVGSREQCEKWLPGLLSRDYDKRLHASQFLTEVQGGSDVGANAVVARSEGGRFRIFGEKWFCSVIDAKLFLLTARPEGAGAGTRGLGVFVVPREIDGQVNEFVVRRLKRKLGTRAMASAETDFVGAQAEPVGELDRGFKNVVEYVLNTSRIFNAASCAGAMHAAFREALGYARHRRAFGKRIGEFPLVAEALGVLRAEAMGALAATLRVTAQADLLALGKADEELALSFRVAVNVNKYWTSVRNTQAVRLAMEVLGGNGAIETFSPLVRLFRDTMVLESWEGAHNVLVEQVLKDAQRYGAHRAFLAELRESVNRLELQREHAGLAELARHGLGTLERAFVRMSDGEGDQRFGRLIVDQAAITLELVALLEELNAFPDDRERRGAIELLAERHLKADLVPPPPLPDGLSDLARAG